MLKAFENMINRFTRNIGSKSSSKIRKTRAWKFIDGNYSQYWCRSSYTGEIREYHYGVLMRTWVKKDEMNKRLAVLIDAEKAKKKKLASMSTETL